MFIPEARYRNAINHVSSKISIPGGHLLRILLESWMSLLFSGVVPRGTGVHNSFLSQCWFKGSWPLRRARPSGIISNSKKAHVLLYVTCIMWVRLLFCVAECFPNQLFLNCLEIFVADPSAHSFLCYVMILGSTLGKDWKTTFLFKLCFWQF